MKNYIWIKFNIILLLLLTKINCDEDADEEKIPAGAFMPLSNYCSQFNRTEILLNSTGVKSLDKDQYVVKNFNKMPLSQKLDYYIRFILASKGLCFYEDGNSLIEFDKWNPPQVSALVQNDKNEMENIEGSIRYTRTTLCSYFYDKYIYESEEYKTSRTNLEQHFVCASQCAIFYNALYLALHNEQTCALPNIDTMVIPPDDIGTRRNNFQNEIFTFCKKVEETFGNTNCKQLDNIEVTNCGFGSEEMKIEYCKMDPGDECCSYVYTRFQTQIKYKLHKESIVTGVTTACIFIIVGTYFSAKFIKEIKIQESIKKSVINQEKEYQESNKQLLQDAYKQGFNPDKQSFNSNSRNLNTGTLRPRAEPMNTMNSYASSSRGSNTTGGTTLGRYPPNSFQISQDYQSSEERDISLKRGMIVQLIQKFEGGWVLVKDINTFQQGYAPEYCLGNKLS